MVILRDLATGHPPRQPCTVKPYRKPGRLLSSVREEDPRPAASDVRTGGAKVSHQLVGRSSFLQRVRQHGQAVRVELAAGQLAFIVGGARQGDDGGCPVDSDQVERAERVADDVTQNVGLLGEFGRFSGSDWPASEIRVFNVMLSPKSKATAYAACVIVVIATSARVGSPGQWRRAPTQL